MPCSPQLHIRQINNDSHFIDLEFGEKPPIIWAMKATVAGPGQHSAFSTRQTLVPLWLKLAYTAFVVVLVPVYLRNYGPTNFLYFCDTALFLTLASVWTENALPASMAAVGILVPQFFWCVDFGAELL